MSKTTVYVVRHAEAAGNLSGTFQGSTDAHVTETGYRQLERLSERFRSVPLEAVYSSPLTRALETAKAVNRHHALRIETLDGLQEIDGGAFEGMAWADIPIRYPDEIALWNERPHDFIAVGGESMLDVYARMKASIGHIVSRHVGQTVAVISHGCAIRALLSYAASGSITGLSDVCWSDNTGVSLIEFDNDMRPRVVYVNDVTHLRAEQGGEDSE